MAGYIRVTHYFDDLNWPLISFVHHMKFNIDYRLNCYSALIQDGQINADSALESIGKPYVMEDTKIRSLCLKKRP